MFFFICKYICFFIVDIYVIVFHKYFQVHIQFAYYVIDNIWYYL